MDAAIEAAEKEAAAHTGLATRKAEARREAEERREAAERHAAEEQREAQLIRPGQVIDRGTVLREHCASGRGAAAAAGSLTADEVDAAFELYRRRLLWQMVKRRWFNALTDFNVERLFTDRDPIFFVRFVGAASAAIAKALSACGDVSDPLSVASLHASGAIKLMLKGGNNVNMITYRALCCLPASEFIPKKP